MRNWLGVLLLVIGCLVSPPTAARKPGPKIVVAWFDAPTLAQIQKAAPKARIVGVSSMDEAKREVADADALVGVVDAELLAAGKRLRWIQVYSAGVDRYRFPALIDSDIVFTNAKVIQGPNVADHALALLLGLSRRIPDAVAMKDDGTWDRERFRGTPPGPIELEGKTAVVIGLGGIGTAIARRVHGFGMTVVGIDPRTDPPPPFVQQIAPPADLDRWLPKADVLIMAAPLTDATRGMLGKAQWALAKPGMLFVNIGRGATVDTDALVEALRSGRVAGAGLDVTEPEPLPEGHPLWTLDNVILTPHIAGTSDGVAQRRVELVIDNVQRFVAGRELRNIVDKRKGY